MTDLVERVPRLRVLSLGAGVQSTTIALMAAKGEITPMPDCAIFADTGWEPKKVYEHLERLMTALPFPTHIVQAGNIRKSITAGKNTTGGRYAAIPWFTEKSGMGLRQCTQEYKIVPIRRKQRELLGYKPRQRIPPNSVEVWIGISTDEMVRMKDASSKWQVNRWPLIEKGMTRHDCKRWLAAHGWDAPKSSCLGCPFHNDAAWRELKNGDPKEWADIVKADAELRENGPMRNMKMLQYMHRSCKPIDEVDFRSLEDLGQEQFGFLQECEGMCGV